MVVAFAVVFFYLTSESAFGVLDSAFPCVCVVFVIGLVAGVKSEKAVLEVGVVGVLATDILEEVESSFVDLPRWVGGLAVLVVNCC